MAADDQEADGGATLLVTQTRSAIGTKPKHRGTLRALGCAASGSPTSCPTVPRSGA